MRDQRLRHLFLRIMTWLLLFWAADGYVQLAFGFDLFGVPMHEDRLNALFYSRYQYYGPTLALLSPLAIDYMRHNWSKAAWGLRVHPRRRADLGHALGLAHHAGGHRRIHGADVA